MSEFTLILSPLQPFKNDNMLTQKSRPASALPDATFASTYTIFGMVHFHQIVLYIYAECAFLNATSATKPTAVKV